MKLLLLVALLPLAAHAWVDEMENDGLFQGDMVLDPMQQEEAADGKFTFGSIRTGLWTKVGDHVTIPYTTDGTIGGTAKAMNALKASFADYHKYTCLRFVPRKSERAYIHFRTGGGCSSPVGMTGRQNTVTLASGCWSRSTVIHEIGHSIGLHHEQSRPDRDGYIKVRWENIPDHIEYNFKKQSTGRVDSRGTKYDYRSVMHYGKTAFGSGKVTMQAINTYYTDLIGVGSGFSDIDVKQINLMYRCPVYNEIVEKVKQTPDCHDTTSYCEMMVLDRGCGGYNKKRCPFSCKQCTPGGGPPPTGPVPTQGPPPPTRTPGGNCRDEHTNCSQFRSYCKNSHWISHMRKNCARTCNYC
jgi:hypothetical protein